MGSMLENYKDADLKRYMKFVFSIIGFEVFQDPEDLYTYDRLNLLFSPMAGNYNRLDIEYLYYLLSNNEKEHLITPGIDIDRPELEDINVTYVVEERQWVNIFYNGSIETYIYGDITDSYLTELRDNTEIDPYEWDSDSDITDSEFEDDSWDY